MSGPNYERAPPVSQHSLLSERVPLLARFNFTSVLLMSSERSSFNSSCKSRLIRILLHTIHSTLRELEAERLDFAVSSSAIMRLGCGIAE